MYETEQQNTERENLSIKETLYVRHFTTVSGDSYGRATESAIAAGFKKELAEATGNRFMKMPRILDAIQAIHEAFFDNYMLSPARLMSDLEHAKAMALKKDDRTSYIRLVELAGKSINIWSEKGGLPEVHAPEPLTENQHAYFGRMASRTMIFDRCTDEQQKQMIRELDEETERRRIMVGQRIEAQSRNE